MSITFTNQNRWRWLESLRFDQQESEPVANIERSKTDMLPHGCASYILYIRQHLMFSENDKPFILELWPIEFALWLDLLRSTRI